MKLIFLPPGKSEMNIIRKMVNGGQMFTEMLGVNKTYTHISRVHQTTTVAHALSWTCDIQIMGSSKNCPQLHLCAY